MSCPLFRKFAQGHVLFRRTDDARNVNMSDPVTRPLVWRHTLFSAVASTHHKCKHWCSFIAIHLPAIIFFLQIVCIIESYKINADLCGENLLTNPRSLKQCLSSESSVTGCRFQKKSFRLLNWKSEQNNFGTLFLPAIHPRPRRNAKNCILLVVKHLRMSKRSLNVSFPLGTDNVSPVLDRYRSTFKSSLGAF